MFILSYLTLLDKAFALEKASANLDTLAFEKPDKFDLKLGKNDMEIANILDQKKDVPLPKSLKVEKNNSKLDKQKNEMRKKFKTDNMFSVRDRKLWEIIYNFIKLHIEDFLNGTKLSFKIHMRYSFCTYILPLLPTEYFLLFPSFYKVFIPTKIKKSEFGKTFLGAIDKFLEKVKERSDKELLPTFTFARAGSSLEDIEFILTIPDLISTDPIKILRWLYDFELEDSKIGLSSVPKKRKSKKSK